MQILGRQINLPRWRWPDFNVLRRIARNSLDHDISAVATQLAFHLTFSFFPMLLVLGVVLTTIEAPFVFARIMVAMHTILPPSAIALVDQVLQEVRIGSSLHVFLAGLSLALWSTVSGLEVLIRAINCAYGVEDDRPYWQRLLLALGLTLLLAILLVVATTLVIGGRWLGVRVAGWLGRDAWFVTLWELLRWPTVLLAVMGGLLVLYTASLRRHCSFWHTLPGVLLGGGGWVISTVLFGWYIKNYASYNRVYGSIGGMIVLMLWLYVGSMVILLGAEFNGALEDENNDCG